MITHCLTAEVGYEMNTYSLLPTTQRLIEFPFGPIFSFEDESVDFFREGNAFVFGEFFAGVRERSATRGRVRQYAHSENCAAIRH